MTQTAHFVQPDDIVANPNNPQDWNRYSYVLDNPISRSDPSGHCSGKQDGADKACWDLYFELQKNYKNVAIIDTFNTYQLQMIKGSLMIASDSFGSQAAFQKAYGNFMILYDPNLSPRGLTPPGLNTVVLGDSTFIQGGKLASDALQIIDHEFNHIFDFKDSGGDPSKYKSQQFINQLTDGSCQAGYLGCLGESNKDPGYAWINSHTGGTGEYSPIGKTSPYGSSASIEDFTESMTGFELREHGINTNIPFDQDRARIIAVDIEKIITASK